MGEKVRRNGIEGAVVGGRPGGEDEEKRIDVLKRFAVDLGWNACQIRKTSLVYFTNPWKKDDNEDFDLWEGS